MNDRGNGMLLVTESRRAGFAQICKSFVDAFGGTHYRFDAMDDSAYRAAAMNVMGTENPGHDIANAHALASFGSDFLSTWGSPTAYSVAYGKFRSGHERGSHYHFGSRYSMTAANADKWIPINPGTEGYAALALGWAVASTHPESSAVAQITGVAGPGHLSEFNPDALVGVLGIPDEILGGKGLREFFEELAHDYMAHGGLAIGGGGEAGAYSNGRFNAEAVLVLKYLLGNVGKAGGILIDPGPVFPDDPEIARLTSLADWQQATADINSGRTRLVVVHNADPAYALPRNVGFGAALADNDVVIISSSPFIDDTTVMADLLIPDRTALEDWGDDSPDLFVGRQLYPVQQPVVNPLSDLDPRSFADVMIATATSLGYGDAMPAASYEELIRANVAELGMDFDEALKNGGWWSDPVASKVPEPPPGVLAGIANRAAPADSVGGGDFQLLPFAHHTVLDGRNAHLPWAQSTPDPLTTIAWQTWVEINEKQGREMNFRNGDVVNITTSSGSIRALVYLNPGIRPGTAAVPMGGGRQSGSDYAAGRDPRESDNVMSILAVTANESGGLTWSANRCSITSTGDSMAVSKLEGDYTSREIGEHPAEQVYKSVSAEGGHGH